MIEAISYRLSVIGNFGGLAHRHPESLIQRRRNVMEAICYRLSVISNFGGLPHRHREGLIQKAA